MGVPRKMNRDYEVPHVPTLGDSMRQAKTKKAGAVPDSLPASMRQGTGKRGKSVKGQKLGATMKQG